MGIGSRAVLAALLALLAGAIVVAYLGWTLAKDVDVPASAYVAMAFGVIISLAVGFGLMAMVFYSSRHGYDEPPVLLPEQDDQTGDEGAADDEPSQQPDASHVRPDR
jgi:mannitol-specific phosphotransferase system IIBC component